MGAVPEVNAEAIPIRFTFLSEGVEKTGATVTIGARCRGSVSLLISRTPSLHLSIDSRCRLERLSELCSDSDEARLFDWTYDVKWHPATATPQSLSCNYLPRAIIKKNGKAGALPFFDGRCFILPLTCCDPGRRPRSDRVQAAACWMVQALSWELVLR